MASAKRVICGLSVAVVWLLAIFVLPLVTNSYLPLVAILCAAAIICLFELCSMLKKKGYCLPFRMLACLTILWFGALYWSPGIVGSLQPYMIGFISMLLLFRILLDKNFEKPMETAALSVVAFLYIPYMLSYMIPLAISRSSDVNFSGIFLVFSIVLITKMSDTGGYFIGSAFGKHKMCPRLSPGKSWEGTIGGYLFSLTAAAIIVACAHIFHDVGFLSQIRLYAPNWLMIAWFFLTVIVMVTVGILGDLLESLFKRQCEVKDSSALFPAMGGFFDTFDSIIFIPVTFIMMMELGRNLLLG
ncbi:MAG: phosphatidate cytidylyltransferase [bacterium]|nr:phosphatidate cytidylyltransferase [bacterium]